MKNFAVLHTQRIECFEELEKTITGVQRDIVQLGRGKMRGRLSHGTIAGLPIDIAAFNRGLRSRGLVRKDRITIGILTSSTERVTCGSHELSPGDLLIGQPGEELDNRHYGGGSVLIISLTPSDIEAMFGSEGRPADPAFWWGHQFNGTEETVRWVIPRLKELAARLANNLVLTAQAAEFWKRAIIETVTASAVAGAPSDRGGPLPSALKTVREIENYLDTQGDGPIHISQICKELRLSRRTLHRAVHEALGLGPISFLRHRRLCSIHATLRTHPQNTATIADLALQNGFLNLGRFSQYYYQLFGEYPSDTRLQANETASSRNLELFPLRWNRNAASVSPKAIRPVR
ncbi:helix-turn-helix domain-containing protein [Bradyrhizobium sp. USDA 3458]|uniref:helix-turn-helix domain-containing protein n=1 Tax=Bradyrhizobium sp. USDA 3458 TaxID=2591461 RepID=UPI001142B003|nr:helix-turn-helix domain-containing protein [Bradyrhizobium sp. USDA 3458]